MLRNIPVAGSMLFIVLHIVVAFLQAFVFTILPVIYVAGAVEEPLIPAL